MELNHMAKQCYNITLEVFILNDKECHFQKRIIYVYTNQEFNWTSIHYTIYNIHYTESTTL